MKTILATTVAVLTIPAFGQQALWHTNATTSPQVNPDCSVTFRLDAPGATSVKVTGDFLPVRRIDTPIGEQSAPGVADLVKNDDGIWEFTTTPLPSELYNYNFVVDGLKITDPSNVYLARDIASLCNIFIIYNPDAKGETDSSLYSVNDVPHGTVSKIWYDSPSLDIKRRMTVYTPAGYEDGTQRYPVLYLLHGTGGDEDAWASLGRATQILDNLIARGEAEPMIVVMPNGNVVQQGAPGETPEGLIVPQFKLPHWMDGVFETTFPDIINFVDSNYRTKADKEHRAIAGLSMGGYHSHHISKLYPDTFGYVGLFSPLYIPPSGVDNPIYADSEQRLREQFDKGVNLYWIGIGRDDFLYDANVDFRRILDANALPYTYYETDGGHIWKNWRIYLSKFAPLLFGKR